jgi:hypothetical protein
MSVRQVPEAEISDGQGHITLIRAANTIRSADGPEQRRLSSRWPLSRPPLDREIEFLFAAEILERGGLRDPDLCRQVALDMAQS